MVAEPVEATELITLSDRIDLIKYFLEARWLSLSKPHNRNYLSNILFTSANLPVA